MFLVGRWFIYKGQLVHRPIMATPSVRRETFLGWFQHYFIGFIFALIHVLIWGETWLFEPTLVPALMTGFVTIVFPFYVIQPCHCSK